MVDCVFSTFRPSLFSSALVSFCSSHEKGSRLESTLRAPSWCIRQPGQFDISVRGEEGEEKVEEVCLFCIFHLSSIFHPSFLFALLMNRRLDGNQLSELSSGVFDNLGSLTGLYVGKKKRAEGCSFCVSHVSSIFLFIPLRFFLFLT